MTTTWRARCSRGHYLASKNVHTTLGPEDWDDTCHCKPAAVALAPSADDFGHQPVSNDVDYWGETTDDLPVCARCTRTVRAWLPVVIGQHPDAESSPERPSSGPPSRSPSSGPAPARSSSASYRTPPTAPTAW